MSKIAIVYSGQPRALRECYPNHKKFLFDPNSKNEIDFFYHLWVTDEDKTLDYYCKELWNVKDGAWDNPKEFSHDTIVPDPAAPHPLNNIVSQAYGFQEAFELMDKYVKENGEYDIVVRTRTDNWFVEEMGDLSDYDSEGLHITDITSHEDYALGDTFAWGDYKSMTSYLNLYNNFEEIVNEGARVNPECLLGWAIKRDNIKVHKHSIYPKLFRDVG
tara:strand:- start:628 stop:1278 length:651 start_codon:yes stop_codon:yes gene_type:complete